VAAEHADIALPSGFVPPLAESYYPRRAAGLQLTGLGPGQMVVLTQGEPGSAPPAALGGTGKTQLAVEFAQAQWNARAVDVLVWVTAASREAILTGFASAADSVGASDPDEDAEASAERFLGWLANTSRSWTLIIDDLADAAVLQDLWPSGPAGQIIITTRLPSGALGTAAADASIIPVGNFSSREALSYLSSRLVDYPSQRAESLDLCEDLNGLPLALAQAAGVINARGQGCREYRTQLAERCKELAGASVSGLPTEVLATWSLAVECAQELPPSGLAWPILALAAMLGPHGIPATVLTSPAACGYITGRPGATSREDQDLVRAAITTLDRLSLLNVVPASPVPMVWMHPSVQAVVRAYLPRSDLVLTAADALTQAWRESGGMNLDQVLRNCTTALRTTDGGLLWQPEPHPMLFRAGASLADSRLTSSAVVYWQSMVATSARMLSSTHPSTLAARERLGAAFESAGRAGDGIAILQGVVGDRERTQGPQHPDTIAARGHLAHACYLDGRLADAVALYQSALTGLDQQLGRGHPDTLAARASLAAAYQEAGLTKESISTYKQLLNDTDRQHGAGHPATLTARAGLGEAYLSAQQPKDAIEQYRRVLAGQQDLHGRLHPETIAARASLASALRRAGKRKDAISQYEQVLTDREHVLGADDPDTIAARANLAFAYRSVGNLREAIPAYERTLADRERLAGADHRDTRTARTNLAAAYQQAGRPADAIPQFERVLADSERMAGPGSMETLTSRASLAAAFYADGRLMDAVTTLERALADCESYLSPDHPMTRTVRENLAAIAET
jgi:tetratricopeptide (TPR) repeat protein